MPRKETIRKARAGKRAGKSPSTQAGEFVKEEMDRIRRGQHGARSARQAIALGLSEARRAGVDLPPPKKGRTSARTRAARNTLTRPAKAAASRAAAPVFRAPSRRS